MKTRGPFFCRPFICRLLLTTLLLASLAALHAADTGVPVEAKSHLVSKIGSERATQGVGNMMVTWGNHTHVVWQDSPAPGAYSNRVRTFDRTTGQWSPVYTLLDAAKDNHARPVITVDGRGFLHVVLGGHHSAVRYLRSTRPNDASQWEPAEEVGIGTYPMLVCGPDGLYAFLDELARRHPDLILDNCAAGGRRLDFEMMRRCIVLWRSDNTWGHETFPKNVQAMTHGLSHWLPLHGLGAAATDDLALRSGMGACGGFSINYRNPKAVAALRKQLESYLKVRPIYTGDYYPLTPHTLDKTSWIAWQFHRADLGESLVQAFRRPEAANETLTVKLRGLDPNQRYEIENLDGGKEVRIGAELMRGLPITLHEKPAAAVFVLKAIK